MQLVLLDQTQCLLGLPAAEQDPGGAVEQHREVAEDEATDEAELDDGQVDVLTGQPPARADALGRVAQGVARVGDALRRRRRPRRVQDQREVVGVTRGAVGRQVLRGEGVDVLRQEREQQQAVARHLAAFRDLLVAAEAHDRGRLRLLDQSRHLGLVEHRRQRCEHHAAVQAPEHRDRRLDRVAAQQDHDLAGLDAALREAVGHPDRGAAELRVGDRAALEEQRDPVGVLLRARVELAPEVALSPVALRVVALGLRLEGQRRPGHFSSPPYSRQVN